MRIHFVGIGGVSMRALADIAESRFITVTGSDAALGGHAAKNVDGADLVVYTNAVGADNCELTRAKELGIPTVERAVYLGELARSYGYTVAVAGCHGKSTATAMTGVALKPLRPTVHVGAVGASVIGGHKMFVTEACEYKASFLNLSPDLGVILNVGYDHPDFYSDEHSVESAFSAFAEKSKTLLVNGDDAACLKIRKKKLTFGLSPACDYRAERIVQENGMRSFIFCRGGTKLPVRLSVIGAHNVYNALAALAAADVCGVPLSSAVKALSEFCGIPRRFERRGIAFGKTVICDYAHHPDEIAATISAAREVFPSVAVVFQPHTYSRTEAMADGFVTALAAADTVVLAPIYAAREAPTGMSSHALCRKLVQKNEHSYCFDTFTEIIDFCKMLDEKAVIFMGAGDITVACDAFMNAE